MQNQESLQDVNVIRPNPGSQQDFISCPYYECLYHGSRGNGKSFALILSFLVFVGRGFKQAYSGYIFRREYQELEEIRDQCHKIFSQMYKSGYKYVGKPEDQFYLPSGERLKLAHAEKMKDYWKYHGKARPFLGFDELCNWPDLKLYERLKSICRSKNIPIRIRATTNSLGPGHTAVKTYFKLNEMQYGSVIKDVPKMYRCNIWGHIRENPELYHNETYVNFLKTQKDENVFKSWWLGSWDIVAGGALSDLWIRHRHIVKPFKIPETWRVYRCLDWGSARPYCVLYAAVSDGSNFINGHGKEIPSIKGDTYFISEIYGAKKDNEGNFIPNEGTKETPQKVRDKMIQREKQLKKFHKISRIRPGPADSAIYSQTRGEDENTIADLFKPIIFIPSVKGKGSRVSGLNLVRQKLENSCPDTNGFRDQDKDGIFFFENCFNSIRTLPILQTDENNPEDIDKKQEDHAFDTVKYFIRNKERKMLVFKE